MSQTEQPEDSSAPESAGHAPARAIPTVEERIAHIVGMMERFEWVRGKSAVGLAEAWGLALGTVEKHSAEASRRIVGDRDEAQRDITIGARKLFLEAVGSGDAKGAKMMGDLWADVAGARAPAQSEVRALVGSTEVSPEAAARLVRETFGAAALPKDDPPTGDAEPRGAPAVPGTPSE